MGHSFRVVGLTTGPASKGKEAGRDKNGLQGVVMKLLKYFILPILFTIIGFFLSFLVGPFLTSSTSYEALLPIIFVGLLLGNGVGFYLAWLWYKRDKTKAFSKD